MKPLDRVLKIVTKTTLFLVVAVSLAGLAYLTLAAKPVKLVFYNPNGGIESERALENPETWDNDWAEAIPDSDSPDSFLNDLLKQFNCNQLPPHCILHVYRKGMTHHAHRYVIKLEPGEYSDLKAHIEATLSRQHEPSQEKLAQEWLPFSHGKGDPDSWTPPNHTIFCFNLSQQESNLDMSSSASADLMGDYCFEYDPQARLLYVEAAVV